jgi:hypothetical protein
MIIFKEIPPLIIMTTILKNNPIIHQTIHQIFHQIMHLKTTTTKIAHQNNQKYKV